MEILSINTSLKKGTPKNPVNSITLVKDSGILNDAHANPTDPTRQVSLLAIESVNKQQKKLDEKNSKIKLIPGIFGENITTKGIDLLTLPIETRIKIGNEVILEISRIGKICHTKCAIYYNAGDCIMPKEGIFGKVVIDGSITTGDKIEVLD